MVKLRALERDFRSEQWLQALAARLQPAERALVARAHERAVAEYGGRLHPAGESWIDHACGTTGVLGALRMDGESLAAALLLGMDSASGEGRECLERDFGSGVVALVQGVASMAPIQALRGRADAVARSSDKAHQLEALRKMLLAMVQDVRVVLIKLADQVQLLRYLASQGGSAARSEAAQDTFELLAPLANRLGVWQLKWELEDLAFRCLEPETYKGIARGLDETRLEREAYIGRVMEQLCAELEHAGIHAELAGRPKHIYSIWNKMQRKAVAFNELSDVRAVRVLVDDVKDCYAALGIVHNLWTPIPREFDDYIARPKANDYRSLHTAVIGPDNRVLEVQIRTHEMHQHAELGVAAHWRYKEKESARVDVRFDRTLSWLRKILDWREELADAGELAESFKTELFEDSVYVLTPQGRVIDLPRGATPIDFAYHVHSELGHRCRGAKVNGRMVPLDYKLSNGQVVEIVAAKEGGPSRDWLNASLGFIRSNRARAKVRQWFNSEAHAQAVASGRASLEKELARLGGTQQRFEALAEALHFPTVEDLFAAHARGEISARALSAAVRGESALVEAPAAQAPAAPGSGRGRAAGVLIVGVDRLLTQLARCCKPAPPDLIVGFVTRGRGVTVHRRGCPNVGRMAAQRLIAAEWGRQEALARFAVEVEIFAASHPALMRDVLDILSREKVRVLSSSSSAKELSARIVCTLEVESVTQLERLLKLVRELPGVAQARRR
jgi:GTP pyrophosphokinase